jgi:hypothetical protein
VRKNLTEAGECFGRFFRGAAPESVTDQARQQVGGELFAKLAQNLDELVSALRSQNG